MTDIAHVPFDEGLRRCAEGGKSLVLFSLTGCGPCDVVEAGMAEAARRPAYGDWSFAVAKVDAEDKRALGRAFKAGVNTFPNVKVVVAGEVVNSYTNVPEGWDATDVCGFLSARLDAVEAGR